MLDWGGLRPDVSPLVDDTPAVEVPLEEDFPVPVVCPPVTEPPDVVVPEEPSPVDDEVLV